MGRSPEEGCAHTGGFAVCRFGKLLALTGAQREQQCFGQHQRHRQANLSQVGVEDSAVCAYRSVSLRGAFFVIVAILHGCEAIGTSLTACRELDLNVNAVTSLGGLQCCSELERLNVDDNKLCCVEGNLPITALTWLSLANNALTSIEGGPLACLAELHCQMSPKHKWLSLAGSFTSSSPAANCHTMSIWLLLMHLNNASVSIFRMCPGIPGCSMLGHLSVQGNKITSLSGLQACTRLCHLDVGLNKLTAFPSSSLSLDSLRHIVLNGNRSQFALICLSRMKFTMHADRCTHVPCTGSHIYHACR